MYKQINPYDTSYYIWTKERVENGELSLDENAFNKSNKKIRKNVSKTNWIYSSMCH